MERLFFFAAILILFFPATALAQEPLTGTVTGIIEDQDPLTGALVTRTITLTLVISPLLVSEYIYTGTYSTGNEFTLERSMTYGEILGGAGALILSLMVAYLHIRELIRGKRVTISGG